VLETLVIGVVVVWRIEVVPTVVKIVVVASIWISSVMTVMIDVAVMVLIGVGAVMVETVAAVFVMVLVSNTFTSAPHVTLEGYKAGENTGFPFSIEHICD